MKYKIEFELPNNETIQKEIGGAYVRWGIWGYSGIAKAEPIEDEPQTEDAYAYDEDDWYDKMEREGE